MIRKFKISQLLLFKMSSETPKYVTTFVLSASQELSQFLTQRPFWYATVGQERPRAGPFPVVPKPQGETEVRRPPALDTRCPGNVLVLIKVKLRENVTYSSLFFFSYRSNISGSHSYPLLSKKNQCGVYKNGNSPSYAFQPRFILISSRIPAYEVQSALRGQAFSESVGQDVRQAVFWLSCVKMIHLLTENQLIRWKFKDPKRF